MGTSSTYPAVDEYAAHHIRHKARSLVGRYGFRETDVEDLEQELTLDVLQRMPKYDPGRAQKKTFVVRLVRNKIASILEARKAGKRDYRTPVYSFTGWVKDRTNGFLQRSETIDQDHYLLRTGRRRAQQEVLDLAIDLKRATDLLPPELRDLCRRLRYETVSEISRETGVPRSTICDAKERIRVHFEERGLRDYL
ncbi:MAG: sigma factor [Candidatus Eisenbacteria bacterium]